MEYNYNLIDLQEYMEYDEIRKGIFEYRAKTPTDTLNRDNHNRFFAKRVLWSDDLHIGEYVSGIIGKRTNFKVCDTELYRHPINYNDRGVISYAHLSENDKLLNPKLIIISYLKYQNLKHNIVSVDVDTVMKAMFWFMYQYKRPYYEFLDFKQDFIDMIIFDLKLLNPDRSFENWYIRQDTKTKAIDLYPMFDNEMSLGFDKEIYSKKCSGYNISEEDVKRTSAIITPSARLKGKGDVSYIELFEFLLQKYPIQTKNSLDKFNNFSSNELLEILNNIEELSEDRKTMIIQLFNCRELGLQKIYSQYLEKTQILQNVR